MIRQLKFCELKDQKVQLVINRVDFPDSSNKPLRNIALC